MMRSLRQIGPIRLIVTLLLLGCGLWLALKSWELPLASDAERALYDLRFETYAVRATEPDPRISLIVYDDRTLEGLGKRSPLDRQILARALSALDQMGARAIGIDIIIDQQQPEDEALIAAFRRMRTPTLLAFATHDANPQQMADWQEQFLRSFIARANGGAVRPASIRTQPDQADGVMRRWPIAYPGQPLSLANAMSPVHPEFRNYSGAIDFRISASDEHQGFQRISIEDVDDPALPAEARTAVIAGFAEQIRGRYVMIGGDINDLDDFETPMTRFGAGYTKGLWVHAQMLAQQLDGRIRRPLPAWSLWLAAILVVLAGSVTAAFEPAGWRLALALAVQVGLIVWLPFQIHAMGMDTLDLPAAGWGAG
jgi:adenylate cyclase